MAVLAAIAGIAVVCSFAFTCRERIRELWYIHRLSSADERTRAAAAERLADLKSVRAVPYIMQALREERRGPDPPQVVQFPNGMRVARRQLFASSPLARALYRLGKGCEEARDRMEQVMVDVDLKEIRIPTEDGSIRWGTPTPFIEMMRQIIDACDHTPSQLEEYEENLYLPPTRLEE